MSSSPTFRQALCFTSLFIIARASPTACAETPPPSVVVDWSKGDSQANDQSCGDIAFAHMEDGHSYNLFVRGREATTCSFSADGLKFVYPGDYGSTPQGKRTLYSFIRFGSEVLISWAPGY